MMYSTGIPFLYVVGFTTAFMFYVVDKLLFSWLYGKPPQYDPSVNIAFTNVLAWGLLLHVAFGTWMLGNKHILSSDAVVSNMTTVANQTEVAAHCERSQCMESRDGSSRLRTIDEKNPSCVGGGGRRRGSDRGAISACLFGPRAWRDGSSARHQTPTRMPSSA